MKGSQRKHLRGLAHDLRPAVQVGKGGLTDAVMTAISAALDDHELIKVKITAERDERQQAATAIEQRLDCECVGQIGRMAILYRQHPDPEQRKIEL